MGSARLTPPVLPRDHILGSPEAKVTLVEFADLQCPHCRLANVMLRDVRAALGEELRYVFRHFPLIDRHPDALNAALASEAAGAQGKFWEMIDLLFEHQNALHANDLSGYAGTLELNAERFDRDFKSGRFVEHIREDFQSGERSDIRGTPTFFVNGFRYDGEWRDADTFARVLRQAMSSGNGAPGVSP